MDPGLPAPVEAFRQELREWLRAHLPEDIRSQVARETMDLPREMQLRWRRALYERGGWTCPSWPEAHGGPGWSHVEQYVFERELALADAPRTDVYGATMLGPTLMEFGTEDQQECFLPPILRGEVMWCQGFSEPGAGSDLAALGCRARRDGDHYVLDGQKIWTSEAHLADWMFGLFRTDSTGRKQHGITFLLVDMASPGITVTPVPLFEGTHEVNQVFFDEVRVPVQQRIGEEHQGWGIAKHLLGLERFGTAEVSRTMASLRRLEGIAARAHLGEEPLFRARMSEAWMALRELELTEQRFLFGPGGPDAMGPEASMLKIRGTELQQEVLALTMEAMGWHAMVSEEDAARSNQPTPGPPEAAWAARNYFNYRKTSIYSGSNEVQRNIIAKAVLGL